LYLGPIVLIQDELYSKAVISILLWLLIIPGVIYNIHAAKHINTWNLLNKIDLGWTYTRKTDKVKADDFLYENPSPLHVPWTDYITYERVITLVGLVGWILFLVGLGFAVGYNTSVIGIALLVPGIILIIIPFFSRKLWKHTKTWWNNRK
jgi:uncharacterized membrane protein HdeD (DUF308 family)